jgi:DNA-binding NarL/FixJ family response regulator
VTRILIVDDHGIIREGLRSSLSQVRGFEVVGEAGDGETALQVALMTSPDVVLMDVALPKLNGIEATWMITAQLPAARVLGLSMHCDRRFVEGMLNAGASGYVSKDVGLPELTNAILAVMSGRTYVRGRSCDPSAETGMAVGAVAESPVGSEQLPRREREVLCHIAGGCTSRQAAEVMGISAKTVETYRGRLKRRLGLYTVADLTKYAIRHGLVPAEGLGCAADTSP